LRHLPFHSLSRWLIVDMYAFFGCLWLIYILMLQVAQNDAE